MKGDSDPPSRRAFFPRVLALALLAAPVAAEAQSTSRVPTVGVLAPGPATNPLAAPSREAFEGGLRDLGWVPGRNIRVEVIQ
jgi:hypothetical protein